VRMKGNLAVVTPEPYSAKPEYGEKCPTDCYATDRNVVNRRKVLDQQKARNEASASVAR